VETRKRIFEAFYTTKESTGTGLGLWVSQGIIEKHGGSIKVRSSQAGKYRGTSFSVFEPYENPTKRAVSRMGS
jgi:signal transduction histidine kinase